jgi:predicted enzyme related to lactoylglutathione lyase
VGPLVESGLRMLSIDGAVADLNQRGVRFENYGVAEQNERGIWKSPSGARVAWFKDPDGNVLSLTQFP